MRGSGCRAAASSCEEHPEESLFWVARDNYRCHVLVCIRDASPDYAVKGNYIAITQIVSDKLDGYQELGVVVRVHTDRCHPFVGQVCAVERADTARSGR